MDLILAFLALLIAVPGLVLNLWDLVERLRQREEKRRGNSS